MRALTLDEFATEAAVPADLVDRLVAVGAITTLEDGRDDSRDEPVSSTAQALIDAGIPFDALAWALTEGRFGLRLLGQIFSEPVPRTDPTYAELAAALGDDAAHLPAWPQRKLRRNVPRVEAAFTQEPSIRSVPPARRPSKSSMQSPPARADRTSVKELVAPVGLTRLPAESRWVSTSCSRPTCRARVAGSRRPASATS